MTIEEIKKLINEEDDGFFSSLKKEVETGDHSCFNEDFRKEEK